MEWHVTHAAEPVRPPASVAGGLTMYIILSPKTAHNYKLILNQAEVRVLDWLVHHLNARILKMQCRLKCDLALSY